MDSLSQKSQITYQRLWPRLEQRCAIQAGAQSQAWAQFEQRLRTNFPALFGLYAGLYADQYDFYYHLEDLLAALAHAWLARPDDLQALDAAREGAPNWYQSNHMLGGVCYVDLFAGNLEGIRSRIPYFKELGLTYLHLMPLFKAPEPENDGGYAVSSYRYVKPALGTMEQLAELARGLRQEGISLVLDLVFNHTSNEAEWAQQALAGDPDAQSYYRIFHDRSLPDAYERTLREIFPDEQRLVKRTASFTYRSEINAWVWTTFHHYQWDLNYANPAVFNRMAEEMLFLANQGVEVIRLDAVAFIWKQMGTSCENLPQAHAIIQAFNACCRIAAPAMLFKSEAIVHPDEVARYIDLGECQLSYNPLIMALLWNTLATREVNLLEQALRERFRLSPGCAWVNYVRCHDDIGWTFSDDDARRLGINGFDHRHFLNQFYTGRFPDSFARGLPFQENPRTGDARISGTCASLAGLEKAIDEDNHNEIDLAIRRILLVHAVIMTIGGIPLIYLGDEVATLNDYSYRDNPAKVGDSRWVHRPAADPERYRRRNDPDTVEGRVFTGLQRLISLRKSQPLFSGNDLQVMNLNHPHVLGYVRSHGGQRALLFANFSEQPQTIPANILRLYGMGTAFTDLLSGESFFLRDLVLGPLGFVCLK